LLESDKMYKKRTDQCYCNTCEQFLPDRFVEGECPHCGKKARGDQCDHCSNILDPLDLLDSTCKVCSDSPVKKETEHFYFELSAFQQELEAYVHHAETNGLWRDNAIKLTKRYLDEGLRDRAVSRDLPNGVSVPVKGYEDKKVYVWMEAVSGYYSASTQWGNNPANEVSPFWKKDAISYYVHGKDNIPFHTIIWPSVLMGTDNHSLPTHIVSSEYLTIEQKKLSTSRNWAVWVPDMLKRYNPDSIRYFLTVNAPENRDADFSWREFIYSHNSELLGAFGNFVNRTFKFIEKFYDGMTPIGNVDEGLRSKMTVLYDNAGHLIREAHFKQGLEEIFDFIRLANKYFDDKKPWIQIKERGGSCNNTMATCVHIIANLAQLLHPFLPFSCQKIADMLKLTDLKWEEVEVEEIKLKDVKPLFERIDVARIEEEVEALNAGVVS